MEGGAIGGRSRRERHQEDACLGQESADEYGKDGIERRKEQTSAALRRAKNGARRCTRQVHVSPLLHM
jgi:hypothetical protein